MVYIKRVYVKIMLNTCVFAAITEKNCISRHSKHYLFNGIRDSIARVRDVTPGCGWDFEAVVVYSKRVHLKIMSNTCVFAAIIESTVFRDIRSTISSTALEIVSRVSEMLHMGMVGTWKQ